MSQMDPHIFEMMMLFCFGCSWPFAIAKTIRTKTVEGKSIVFIIMVVIGYLAGIISKLTGEMTPVIWLYVINGSMVSTEIVLYFRYQSTNTRPKLLVLKPKWKVQDCSGKPYGFDKPSA